MLLLPLLQGGTTTLLATLLVTLLLLDIPVEAQSFLPGHVTEVTAVEGTTAVLRCSLWNTDYMRVTWKRSRDLYLLSMDEITYTPDDRFTAEYSAATQEWLLKIHDVHPMDAGFYECRAIINLAESSNHFVSLSVVEPEPLIVEGPEVYINAGSTLILNCKLQFMSESLIFWYHNDKLLDNSDGDGLNITTQKEEVPTSTLRVPAVRQTHSGRYKCTTENSKPTTVNVHVLSGTTSAAGTLTIHPYFILLLLLLLPVLSCPLTPSSPAVAPSRPITH